MPSLTPSPPLRYLRIWTTSTISRALDARWSRTPYRKLCHIASAGDTMSQALESGGRAGPKHQRTKHHTIAGSGVSWARLGPNACQKECQMECQTDCPNVCRMEWHKDCQIQCRNECQTECQNECQNKYHIECKSSAK